MTKSLHLLHCIASQQFFAFSKMSVIYQANSVYFSFQSQYIITSTLTDTFSHNLLKLKMPSKTVSVLEWILCWLRSVCVSIFSHVLVYVCMCLCVCVCVLYRRMTRTWCMSLWWLRVWPAWLRWGRRPTRTTRTTSSEVGLLHYRHCLCTTQALFMPDICDYIMSVPMSDIGTHCRT